MIEYRDVQAAQARIAPHIVRTPLLRVPALDEALGCQVYLKHEGFQTIGAFKLRGALNKALSLSEEKLGRGLVCASSGNHAQGVAYAAHKLGAQAVIVMPTNTNPVKLAGVKRWGGQVELVGTLSSQREERAAQLVRERGMVEIPPYADPLVAAGQGTLALEVLEDLPDASLIAAPIGGGGLISGVATAVVLGVGRAIGEAMAIIMVSGNVPNMPESLFAPVRFLTTAIASEMSYAAVGSLWQQALYSVGLVLFLFIMIINVILNVCIKNRKEG